MEFTLWEHIKNWVDNPGVNILVIIVIAWWGLYFGRHSINRLVDHLIRPNRLNPLAPEDLKKRRDTVANLVNIVWKVFVVVVATLMVFRQLFPDIQLTAFFASAGIVGVAVGFGAQSLIKDFLSGMFIIAENQYRVGDIVEIEGASGTVERLTLRSTILRDANGDVHFLPNGMIQHVINKTMGYSKVNFSLAVDPETDVDKVAKVIDEIGLKLSKEEAWRDHILEAPHFLSVGTISDLALELNILGKTTPSQQWAVTGEMRRRLLKAFEKHKVELAHLPASAKK